MNGDLTKRLIKAILSEDRSQIQQMLTVVVAEERKKGHTLLANQIEVMMKRKPTSQMQTLKPLGRKQSDHSLVVEIPREQLRHDMVLCDPIEQRFRRIEQEFQLRDQLAHYGLRYRQKILLYGTPGCGKTIGAERLAWNTGLPLIKVCFDALMSSYLGETGTNLRRVFEVATESPCLLFIDECDAIAKSRQDEKDVGEVKRVVNSFLQLLDEYEASNGLLVAATNLTSCLDEAVWRRFDDVIEIPKPTATEIEKLLRQAFASVEVGEIDWALTILKLNQLSAAQIINIAQDAAKSTILDGNKIVTEKYLDVAIENAKLPH